MKPSRFFSSLVIVLAGACAAAPWAVGAAENKRPVKVEFSHTPAPQTDEELLANYTKSVATVTFADGGVRDYPLSYVTLFKNTDKIARVKGKRVAAGQLFDAAMNPIIEPTGDPAIAETADANSLLAVGGKLFLVTHSVMFADRQANRIAGRALSIYFGAAFDLLRWGHLLHHIYSRTRRERSEVFSGARPTLRFTMAYYLRISGGLYAAEVCGSALLLLPRRWLTAVRRHLAADDNVIDALAERLLAPQVLRSARFDALCILTAHALALWLYGAHAWLYILSLAGRGFMISIVDNAFHYGTALDAPRAGMNLRLPGFLSALILHFNLHGVHHLRPGLPWRQLPAYHAKLAAGYQDDWWPAVLRQWRGPLAESSLRERHALKTA